jgi:hypothetical protein
MNNEIRDAIVNDPDECYTVFTPEGEEEVYYWGIVTRGCFEDVWMVSPEESEGTKQGSFSDVAKARAFVAEQLQALILGVDDLYEMKALEQDEAVKNAAPLAEPLWAPFRFSDTTDHTPGRERYFANLDEVLAFFESREDLLDEESWGNLYSAGMSDANGVGMWAVRSARGGLLVLNENELAAFQNA